MISDASIRQKLISAFPFLGAAEKGFAETLLQTAILARLDAGQPICHEGDRCGALPLLLAGSARVFKGSSSGREITLYRLGPGESCVLTASCILSTAPFPASAVCESPVEAVLLPAADVSAWLARSPAWRAFVFDLVADRLHRIIQVVEDVVFQRMDQRLADYLRLQSASAGTDWIQVTHQQIADDLGTSREVVSRLLKDLELRRLVEAGRGRLRVLDPGGLGNLDSFR